MSKTFLEVFPTLEVDADIKGLLEKAEVTKISANHDKSHIRIYLLAERLIEKKYIWYLEKLIQEQIFAGKNVIVKIIESFRLSEQYNAQTLLQSYRESMLEELSEYSVLEGNLLQMLPLRFALNYLSHPFLPVLFLREVQTPKTRYLYTHKLFSCCLHKLVMQDYYQQQLQPM